MDSAQHNGAEIPRFIWIIGSPIILTVGVLGNIMTVSVLSHPSYKRSSTSVFLMFLAVADLFVITTILPRWWLIYLFGIDIRHVNNGFCKVHWFFSYFWVCVSNVTLVAVTVERIIIILKPHKLKIWCTTKSAVGISIIIIFALIAFHAHTFFGLKLFTVTEYYFDGFKINGTIQFREDQLRLLNATSSTFDTDAPESFGYKNKTVSKRNITDRRPELEHDNETIKSFIKLCNATESEDYVDVSDNLNEVESFLKNNMCELILLHKKTISMCWFDDQAYGNFFLGSYHLMVICIYYVIPEVSILFGIILIIRYFSASRKLRKGIRAKDKSINSKKSSFESHSTQITRSLILINIVFLSCTIPVQFFLLGRAEWIDANKGMTETQQIIWGVFNMLFFVNHAINFILYFLSGSRFRKQVKEILRCNSRRDALNGGSLRHNMAGAEGNRRSHSNYVQGVSSISQF